MTGGYLPHGRHQRSGSGLTLQSMSNLDRPPQSLYVSGYWGISVLDSLSLFERQIYFGVFPHSRPGIARGVGFRGFSRCLPYRYIVRVSGWSGVFGLWVVDVVAGAVVVTGVVDTRHEPRQRLSPFHLWRVVLC